MESDKKVFEVEKKRFFLNTRQKTIFFISLSLLFVLYVFIHGSLITDDMLKINFMEKNLAPSWQHPFGATMSGAVVALARRYMTKPTHIRAQDPGDEGMTVKTTRQVVYRTHALNKVEEIGRAHV